MSGLTLDMFQIGAAKMATASPSMFFDGQMDDVCMWDFALTESELRSQMYEELNGSETDLFAYYNFNAVSGTNLEDITANTFDGVLTNMAGTEWTESYGLVVPEPQAASDVLYNGFTANWITPVTGTADGYYLDISIDSDFSSFVIEGQDVTSTTSYEVADLNSSTTYFYRVCSYKSGLGNIGAWHYNNITVSTDIATVEPNIQAINITASDITYSEMTLDWERGNGENCIVFAKKGNNSEPLPVDGITYLDNSEFGFGDEISSNGWYCIYNGTETSVTVTELINSTEYRFMVIEYNTGNSDENYLTTVSDGNPANFSTLSVLKENVIVSNFLSPDDNGKNDVVTIEGLAFLSDYQFYIMNNLGEILYQTNNYDNSWNASYNGNKLPNGTYYYILSDNNNVFKGTITVVR